jgi:cyclopropane fatty-acyl-phospholipid synthase-like methyltransferase
MKQDAETIAYYRIAYRNHGIMNPLADDRLLLLAGQCGLNASSHILDVGCGNGHAALLLCNRWDCSATLLECSPEWTNEARQRFRDAGREHRLVTHCMDAEEYEGGEPAFDLAICLGTAEVYGGFALALEALRRLVRRGGHIIIGEVSMDITPPARYRKYLEEFQWNIQPSGKLLHAIHERELELLWALRSTTDEWDSYMSLQWQAIAGHAALHHDDAQAKVFLEWSRDEQETYLRYQRHYVDWNVMLLRVD